MGYDIQSDVVWIIAIGLLIAVALVVASLFLPGAESETRGDDAYLLGRRAGSAGIYASNPYRSQDLRERFLEGYIEGSVDASDTLD